MAKTLAALGGPAIDANNPATVNAAVQNLITQCAPSAGPPAASCTTDLPQLGEIAVSLAGSYCADGRCGSQRVYRNQFGGGCGRRLNR